MCIIYSVKFRINKRECCLISRKVKLCSVQNIFIADRRSVVDIKRENQRGSLLLDAYILKSSKAKYT